MAVLVVALQLFFYSSIVSASLVRFVFSFLLIMLYRYASFEREDFINFSSAVVVIICLSGLFQFIDGLILNNYFGFNYIIAELYPYRGELSESALAKVSGAQIKSGSLYRSTSIFDGHPIVYGDFLALVSIFFLYWKKYFIYFLILASVLLTFSRGSWLIFFLGFFIETYLQQHTFCTPNACPFYK